MTLPRIVTNAVLQQLAAPGETHEVHVIVRRIANAAPYTLRGRHRQYIVSRDVARNAHILKVPLSLWMASCVENKPIAENDSIAYDIQSTRTGLKSPLTFEVWPIAGKTEQSAAVANSDAIVDGALAYNSGKPPSANPFCVDSQLILHTAWLRGFEIAEALSPAPKAKQEPAPSGESTALSNKERQAAYRARKRAEKEAAEAEAEKLATA